MKERKTVLPRLTIGSTLSKAKSSPDFPSPRSQLGSTFEATHRSRGPIAANDSKITYRSPAVQNKHEILLLLKDLRKGEKRPSIKQAKTVSHVLETLARERGYYSEEMMTIAQEVNRVVFCEREEIPAEVLQFIYKEDVELMLQEDSQIPYFYVTEFLYRLVTHLNEVQAQMQQSFAAQARNYESQLSQKESEIRHQQSLIEELRQAKKPLEEEIAKGAEEYSKLLEAVKSYQSRLDKMEEKYRTAKVALKEDLRLIADLEGKVKLLNTTAVEASVAMGSMEQEHHDLLVSHMEVRDEYQSIVLRVHGMEKKLESAEEEKRLLEAEIYRLKVRAAAGFEELTPRPSFSRIYDQLSVDAPPFPRTEEHITEILKQIRSLQVRAMPSPRQRTMRKSPPPNIEDSEDASTRPVN